MVIATRGATVLSEYEGAYRRADGSKYEAWAQMQRAYLQWLRQAYKTGGEASQGAKRSTLSMPPLPPGLTFGAWPGPGDSEGGGWDR